MFHIEIAKSDSGSNLSFSDYFPNSQKSFFLLTYNLNNSSFLKSVNAFVLEEILKLKPNSISENNIKDKLVEFFNDLHWKINAMFNKSGDKQKGISLFFAIKRNENIYFVQFGRLAIGLITEMKFREIGLSWDMYPIATVESLNQLGSIQQDIPVNVHSIVLGSDSTLFAFPSKQIPIIKESVKHGANSVLTALLAPEEEVNHYIYISNLPEKLMKPMKFFRGHSFRVSAIVFSVIIIVTMLYYFLGDNYVEQVGYKTEESLTSHNILFELKNLTDSINNPELEKQLAKYVYSPAKDLSLKIVWQGKFTHNITYPPLFDYNNIYLIIENNIAAVSKKSKEVVWQIKTESVILEAKTVENNLLIHCSNNEILLLNAKGDTIWRTSQRKDIRKLAHKYHSSIIVTRKEDKRLNSGIMIDTQNNQIDIFSLITGENVSSITFDAQVKYISDYDTINNCLYAIVGQNLVILKLSIKVW